MARSPSRVWGGAKGKGKGNARKKGKAAGKSEMPERGEWAAVDEVVSPLDAWEKKQN